MKLTNKKLKQLIRESITSQIKKMTPYEREKRKLHHAFQIEPHNPEGSLEKIYTDKLKPLRASGDDNMADELAYAFGASEDLNPTTLFGLSPEGYPGDKPTVPQRALDMSIEDYRAVNKYLYNRMILKYGNEESAFLEIDYRLSWLREYELSPSWQDHLKREEKNKALIEKSKLVEIVDKFRSDHDVFKFEEAITDYITNASYAKERGDLGYAFTMMPTDGLPQGGSSQKPWLDQGKSWFTYTSGGDENSIEEFLLEKAERLKGILMKNRRQGLEEFLKEREIEFKK